MTDALQNQYNAAIEWLFEAALNPPCVDTRRTATHALQIVHGAEPTPERLESARRVIEPLAADGQRAVLQCADVNLLRCELLLKGHGPRHPEWR